MVKYRREEMARDDSDGREEGLEHWSCWGSQDVSGTQSSSMVFYMSTLGNFGRSN